MPKIRTLRECSIFRGMSYRDLAVLAPFVQEETASASDWIFKEGDETSGLIILQSGAAQLSLTNNVAAQIEIGPGDFFGELSLMDGGQRRAVGAQAIENCNFLRVDPRDYQALSSKSAPVAAKMAKGILESMSQKMEETKELLTDLGLEKAEN